MTAELASQLLMLAATAALSLGAFFFRELRNEIKELRRELALLNLAVTGVETNRMAIADHEQRIRALEKHA